MAHSKDNYVHIYPGPQTGPSRWVATQSALSRIIMSTATATTPAAVATTTTTTTSAPKFICC